MGNTRHHDHYCPYCEKRVSCETASRDEVGCLFDATDDLTCNGCIRERWPKTMEKDDA